MSRVLPPALPPGKTVKLVGNQTFLVSKRRVRRFKLPAKTRNKIAASARRFKIPLLTSAAVGIPIGISLDRAGGLNALGTQKGLTRFGDSMLAAYTGFSPLSSRKFDVKRMAEGLGPLLVLTGVKRLNLFKGVNTMLARSRIPLRLS